MMTLKSLALLALPAMLALSGCGDADEVPVESNVANFTAPEAIVVEQNVATPAPPPPANIAEPTPPADTSAEFNAADDQTFEDADATGMTSRVDRGGDEAAPTE